MRDDVKYGRLIAFAEALPGIRRRCARDLEQPGLPREKVLAAVVQLLEKTLIRIGNEEYARDNGSIGLTTMRDGHAKVNGSRLRFAFKGKSGVSHAVDLEDRRLAKIVKACRELPGYELFQYVDADGTPRTIESSDVNEYLRGRSAAPTSPPRISGPGREPSWRPANCRRLPDLRAARRRTATSCAPWKRWQNGSGIPGPSAASATSTLRSWTRIWTVRRFRESRAARVRS